ncbi:hypothetical protein EHS25_001813 [Saitozyma podzolica]|uniref:Uncharacterized protein n=1 Tax=Saitozyma podzolica TaxID=1890683 RepID=A0A427YFR4_9TREE|nr:hypothetical protein EHS25_001813 [Saitozyma podzolica]
MVALSLRAPVRGTGLTLCRTDSAFNFDSTSAHVRSNSGEALMSEVDRSKGFIKDGRHVDVRLWKALQKSSKPSTTAMRSAPTASAPEAEQGHPSPSDDVDEEGVQDHGPRQPSCCPLAGKEYVEYELNTPSLTNRSNIYLYE